MEKNQLLNRFVRSKYFIPFCLLVLLMFYYIPFINRGIAFGHDLIYHLSRAMGAFEQLKLGIFPAKVLGGFYGGYGYAVGLFYPTGLLYIISVLLYFGVNLLSAYQFWIVIITFSTLVSMYYSSYSILPSKRFALISTFIYVFSVYRNYTDLLARAALGEYIVFIFIPIVFASYYAIVNKKQNQWLWLSIGMFGILTSHIISTIWVILLLIIYTLIHFKSVFFNIKTLFTIIKAALFTLLISIYYWLPMLEMMASDTFRYEYPWTHLADNVITTWTKLFYIDAGLNVFPYGIEIWLVILLIISLLTHFKSYLKHEFMTFTLIVLAILFLFVSNLIPVNLLSVFDFMQFPWRVYLYISYFISIAVAYFIYQLSHKVQIPLTIGLLLITIYAYFSSFNFYYIENANRIYYSFPRYQIEHFYGEFLPKNANMDYITEFIDPYMIVISNPIEITYEKKTTTFDIYFNQDGYTNTNLEIPLLYYKGYSAYLTSGSQTVNLPIEKTDFSLMSINLQDYPDGVIHFYYQGTRIQKISALISISTVILSLLFFIIDKYKLIAKLSNKKV